MRIQQVAATAVLSVAATGLAAATANAAPAHTARTTSTPHAQQTAAVAPGPVTLTLPAGRAARPVGQPRSPQAQRDQTAHLEAALVGGVIGGIVGVLLGAPLIEIGGPIVTVPVGALIGGAIGYLVPVARS